MPETLFKKIDYTLNHLLLDIDHGDIGLPELQRPFVWKPVQVRDLFDSMYRGFPVGYLLFWSNAPARGAKQIGTQEKQTDVPLRLVVDGQQRLTSLYSVLRGRKVLDHLYRQRRISIAFHPPTERFETTTPAHRKNAEWIADISTIWQDGKGIFTIINDYLAKIRQHREVGEGQESRFATVIDRLYDLQHYPFTALEIAHTVGEEQVSEIFVRINSKGVRLQQADFILTLMSVFWDEGRRQLEDFCRSATEPSSDGRPSPYNRIYTPEPDQLLRVLVGLALERAVLQRVYGLLRGRDVKTGEFSAQARQDQFQKLHDALPGVLDLTNWHEFIKCLAAAGYRRREAIMSKNAVIFSYTLFLMGRTIHGLTFDRLRPLIARWFYGAAATARLTGSFETDMEAFLGRLGEVADATAFVDAVEHDIALMLTNDFWTLVLPENLATPAARSPALYAFEAAQCVLGAPVLFSTLSIGALTDPALKPKKKSLDRHHLFPRAYLKKTGVTKRRQINQIANQTLVEWPDNIKIGGQSPADYLPKVRAKFNGQAGWDNMMRLHALPDRWEQMPYDDFLRSRRTLMADLIRRGYQAIPR